MTWWTKLCKKVHYFFNPLDELSDLMDRAVCVMEGLSDEPTQDEIDQAWLKKFNKYIFNKGCGYIAKVELEGPDMFAFKDVYGENIVAPRPRGSLSQYVIDWCEKNKPTPPSPYGRRKNRRGTRR